MKCLLMKNDYYYNYDLVTWKIITLDEKLGSLWNTIFTYTTTCRICLLKCLHRRMVRGNAFVSGQSVD